MAAALGADRRCAPAGAERSSAVRRPPGPDSAGAQLQAALRREAAGAPLGRRKKQPLPARAVGAAVPAWRAGSCWRSGGGRRAPCSLSGSSGTPPPSFYPSHLLGPARCAAQGSGSLCGVKNNTKHALPLQRGEPAELAGRHLGGPGSAGGEERRCLRGGCAAARGQPGSVLLPRAAAPARRRPAPAAAAARRAQRPG